MIISRITGGIGNQLFQYAIAKSISVKNADIFKLDIHPYKNYMLHSGYRLNLLNIEENIANSEEILNLKGNDNNLFKVLRKLKIYKKNTYLKEKHAMNFDPNVFNYNNVYLNGYWQNEKYFINIRDILLKEITPKKKISEIANNYLSNIQNTISVGLHVRRGDYLKLPHLGVLEIDYYKKAYDYILQNIDKAIFYIFSNDLTWCQNNFDFINNKVFVKETRSEIDDLILMKSCQHNIIANSSFSWWAAWLNQNSQKIILAPKKWFESDSYSNKLLCENWIKF